MTDKRIPGSRGKVLEVLSPLEFESLRAHFISSTSLSSLLSSVLSLLQYPKPRTQDLAKSIEVSLQKRRSLLLRSLNKIQNILVLTSNIQGVHNFAMIEIGIFITQKANCKGKLKHRLFGDV